MTWLPRHGLTPSQAVAMHAVDLMAASYRRGVCVRFAVFLQAAKDCGSSKGGSFLRAKPERMVVVPATREREVVVWSN